MCSAAAATAVQHFASFWWWWWGGGGGGGGNNRVNNECLEHMQIPLVVLLMGWLDCIQILIVLSVCKFMI